MPINFIYVDRSMLNYTSRGFNPGFKEDILTAEEFLAEFAKNFENTSLLGFQHNFASYADAL